MSIEIQALAKEPKRERGKQRVASLMDAGAELFAEKGYEATTMTEIASRAGAAIGSLYQFFPSKEALAEALFNRFAERAAAAFAQVEARAPGCSTRELADLFIDYKLRQGADRDAAVIALSSGVAGIVERRKPLGDALRGRIASILSAANPALGQDAAAAAAIIVNQVMKMIPALASTEDERSAALIGEARKLLALYIDEVLRR
jgi:AcrR family transcriptional regulator